MSLTTQRARWRLIAPHILALVGVIVGAALAFGAGDPPCPAGLDIELGAPMTGGTRSGLVVFAGSQDGNIRAADMNTGAELWRFRLPEGATATPMSYVSPSGRQFAVIAAPGGTAMRSAGVGHLLAFARPERVEIPVPSPTQGFHMKDATGKGLSVACYVLGVVMWWHRGHGSGCAACGLKRGAKAQRPVRMRRISSPEIIGPTSRRTGQRHHRKRFCVF